MPVHVHHADAGQGLPLVLLHGFPLSSAMWEPQRRALAAVCRVITPDQRGFGRSPLGDDPPSLEYAADDLAVLLDRLGLDRVVLGGLSMGGYVAMRFSARYPDRVAGLVLADTKATADPPEVRDRREQVARRMLEPGGAEAVATELVPGIVGHTTREQRPEVLRHLGYLVRAAPAESIAWGSRAMAARPDSLDVLATMSVPALVVVGEEDEFTPASDAEAMVDVLPDARLVTIPRAGHMSSLEEPEAFDAAVRDFVTGLP
ncbi:MAG TPA: alpha/beta hydrolase [Mycobacteriales bacterium]|nr:alpha/beta hydrolase [Mycobacteriales bacterium]